MIKISTGEDSTLKTYRKIAEVIGEKAVEFIDKKISASKNGEDEEVIVEESQMLYLLSHIGDCK